MFVLVGEKGIQFLPTLTCTCIFRLMSFGYQSSSDDKLDVIICNIILDQEAVFNHGASRLTGCTIRVYSNGNTSIGFMVISECIMGQNFVHHDNV